MRYVVAALTLALSVSFLGASTNVLGDPVEETPLVTDKVLAATNGNSGNVHAVQNVRVAPHNAPAYYGTKKP